MTTWPGSGNQRLGDKDTCAGADADGGCGEGLRLVSLATTQRRGVLGLFVVTLNDLFRLQTLEQTEALAARQNTKRHENDQCTSQKPEAPT